MEDEIAKKMYLYYNELLSEKDCKDLAEDITEATKEEKYNKLINEWLNDEENYSDISIKGFSLLEVARKLDNVHPNIPIAVLLGYLAETNSIEFQVILSIASNICIADYKLIENGLTCEKAVLNDGNWFLFSNNTTSDSLIECQMWQVLILNPLLAPQLSYKHNNNTAILLQDDGSYLIVPNAEKIALSCLNKGGKIMELIDVLDERTGEKTGEIISKDEAHKIGKWHGSIHILIINNSKDKTLLQKRCSEKKLYPNTWDIAVGGHISSGEDAITSAKRELEEELGIIPNSVNLELVDRITEKLVNNGVISNEYVSIFVIYTDIDITNIKLQKEEVSEAKWCSKAELNEFIKNNHIIPHVREYEILNEILK